MSSKDTLNSNILAITLKINNQYPELSKFLNEMPATIPNQENPEVNNHSLEQYYNSLVDLLKEYKETHQVKMGIIQINSKIL
ncbi:hypothetical protein [Flavobacterium dankookense]|uniref:Uncharacterized protein n=1 Tax=Flavobacterium dankookense TaxID=706186 RepID=A0A4R6QF77_9FLAO|nr:hypothetical protein [Flavobacterium dankookense]TDP60927.1 hypothetical protein BC748_0529 [Flavobacterium dankookense]